MTEISYDQATAAQRLGDAIIRFGIAIGGVKDPPPAMSGPELMQVLDDALVLIERLRGAATTTDPKDRIKVDIFWERQGWYFHETKNTNIVSAEYDDIDTCIRA